ncbi:unnamed protein product [Paramecium sonneborni]|uniref:Uncharacterized protein n=1 Tax=Paramecium sonneborni TaxID=65129 RepID=A0A8S1QV90_9CILI|nr:unnamed protein product [Paramecium sonneborni]
MIRFLSKNKQGVASQKLVIIFFKNKDNSLTKVTGLIEQNVLQIIHKNKIDWKLVQLVI